MFFNAILSSSIRFESCNVFVLKIAILIVSILVSFRLCLEGIWSVFSAVTSRIGDSISFLSLSIIGLFPRVFFALH